MNNFAPSPFNLELPRTESEFSAQALSPFLPPAGEIRLFDLHSLYLGQQLEIDAAIRSTLGSGHYILGQAVVTFEKEFGHYLDPAQEPRTRSGVVGCNSGTDALTLSLLALDIGAGDEVITVSHTACATIAAILATGARPVFADVDPATWLLDCGQLEALLTPRTRAVIPVHLYGNAVAVPELLRLLQGIGRPDIQVIEDCAQAAGAKIQGARAGTLGRFGAFSFYPTKNLPAMGDAGGIYCSSGQDRHRIAMLRQYGQRERNHSQLPRGINSRLDEIQAAILSVRLGQLDAWNQAKARIMEIYRAELGPPGDLEFQTVAPGITPAWHLCVVRVDDTLTRDRLRTFLQARKIETLIHYARPVHLQPAYHSETQPTLPITEVLAPRILSLPLHPFLTDAQLATVIGAIRRFFSGH